jgi:metalloprotease
VMTDAASDAVTAITLTDENVKNLAQGAAQVSDSKHIVAPIGNPYDTRLRRLIADFSERDGNTFNFKVYLTKEVNAFAMADGTIRVYSGLLDLMNDEELLFIIGHEMGHVVKKHSRKKVVLAYASSALKKGLASQDNEVGQIARSVVGTFAEQLANAQFSQHEERQADQYGAAFLQGEGHDPSAAVSALNKLTVLAKRHTFLSSHPDPESRAKRLLLGDKNESDDQKSLYERLLEYGKTILAGLFNLVRTFLNWIFSVIRLLTR